MGIRDLTLQDRMWIKATPDRVWAVMVDIRRWPEWNRACIRVGDFQGKPSTVGFRFSMVLRMAKAPVPFHPAVTEVDAPRKIVWSSTQASVTGERTFTLERIDDGTLITDTKRFTSPVLPLRAFYPRPVIARMSRTWLTSLKAEAERVGR